MRVRAFAVLIPAIMLMVVVFPAGLGQLHGEDLNLTLRSQRHSIADDPWVRLNVPQTWHAAETAVIVCDVWDKHHCLNAVRRLEEFALNLINGEQLLPLDGRWQFRIGDDPAWSNIPLPAKFGIGPDVLFEP